MYATRTALRRCVASALAQHSRSLNTAQTGLGVMMWGTSFGSSSTRSPSAVAAVSSALRHHRAVHSTAVAGMSGDVPPPYEDKNLSQVLIEELEHERTTYKPNEAIERGPPEPWVSSDDEGDCEITLTRTYGDNEEISVVFNVSEVRRVPPVPPGSPRFPPPPSR